MFCNICVIAFSSVEEGILVADFGDEMVGTTNCSSMYVLANAPRFNVVGTEALYNGINVMVFTNIGTSQYCMSSGACIFQ